MKNDKSNVIAGISMVFFLFAAMFPESTCASAMKRQSTKDLVDQSSLIVRGRVLDVSSYWNSDHSAIFTDVAIEVESVLRGELGETSITVQLMGGSIGNIKTVIVGGPSFAPDEEVILFLKQEARIYAIPVRPKYHLVALSQGKFNIMWDSTKVRKIAKSDASEYELISDREGEKLPPGGREGLAVEDLIRQIGDTQRIK